MGDLVELLGRRVPVAELLPDDLVAHVLRLLVVGKGNLLLVLRHRDQRARRRHGDRRGGAEDAAPGESPAESVTLWIVTWHAFHGSTHLPRVKSAAMIQRTILLTAVMLLGAGAADSTQQVDFNGVWRLDRDESQVTTGEGLAGLGDSAPENLYISQARNGTVILSSRINGSQPRVYEMNGQTWLPALHGNDTKILVHSNVRGLRMSSEGSGEIDGETVTIVEHLTMGRNGQLLALQTTTTRMFGAETNNLLYRRAGGGGR